MATSPVVEAVLVAQVRSFYANSKTFGRVRMLDRAVASAGDDGLANVAVDMVAALFGKLETLEKEAKRQSGRGAYAAAGNGAADGGWSLPQARRIEALEWKLSNALARGGSKGVLVEELEEKDAESEREASEGAAAVMVVAAATAAAASKELAAPRSRRRRASLAATVVRHHDLLQQQQRQLHATAQQHAVAAAVATARRECAEAHGAELAALARSHGRELAAAREALVEDHREMLEAVRRVHSSDELDARRSECERLRGAAAQGGGADAGGDDAEDAARAAAAPLLAESAALRSECERLRAVAQSQAAKLQLLVAQGSAAGGRGGSDNSDDAAAALRVENAALRGKCERLRAVAQRKAAKLQLLVANGVGGDGGSGRGDAAAASAEAEAAALRVENAALVQRVGAHETRLRKLKPVLESLLAVRTGLSSGEVPSPPPDFVLPDYGMVELDPHAGALAPLLNAHTKAALTW